MSVFTVDVPGLRDEISKHPRKADTHYALGVALLDQDRYREANSSFRCLITSCSIPSQDATLDRWLFPSREESFRSAEAYDYLHQNSVLYVMHPGGL